MLFLHSLYRAAWKLSAAFYGFWGFFRRSFRIRRFTLETASSVASGLEWDFTTWPCNHGSFRYGKLPCLIPPSSWFEKCWFSVFPPSVSLPYPSHGKTSMPLSVRGTEGKEQRIFHLFWYSFQFPTIHGLCGHSGGCQLWPSHGSLFW